MDMLSYCLDYNQTLFIGLVVDVKNIQSVMEAVMQGDLKCALIKPQFILDPFQIVVAANKAVVAQHNGKLKRRSIYTEIIYNLSPSKNVKTALDEFGVKDDRNFLICVIGNNGEESEKAAENVCSRVEGTVKFPSPHELKSFYDEPAIIKRYSITSEELKVSDLLSSVVTRIAVKDGK